MPVDDAMGGRIEATLVSLGEKIDTNQRAVEAYEERNDGSHAAVLDAQSQTTVTLATIEANFANHLEHNGSQFKEAKARDSAIWKFLYMVLPLFAVGLAAVAAKAWTE